MYFTKNNYFCENRVLFPEDHQHGEEEEEDDNEVRISPNEIRSIGELEKKKNIFEAVASVPRQICTFLIFVSAKLPKCTKISGSPSSPLTSA